MVRAKVKESVKQAAIYSVLITVDSSSATRLTRLVHLSRTMLAP